MKNSINPGTLAKGLVVSASCAFIVMAQASTVAPPPLPTGSTMVRQHVGMNNDEVKRSQRAHHHNKHHKKNYMRDDTLDEVSRSPTDDQSSRSGGNQNIPKAK